MKLKEKRNDRQEIKEKNAEERRKWIKKKIQNKLRKEWKWMKAIAAKTKNITKEIISRYDERMNESKWKRLQNE